MTQFLLTSDFDSEIEEVKRLARTGKGLSRTKECDVYRSIQQLKELITELSTKPKNECGNLFDTFFETNDDGITYMLKKNIFCGTITEIEIKQVNDNFFKLEKFSVEIINN